MITGLMAEAEEGKKPVMLPLRVARHEGELVLDLGRPDGKAVVIGAGKWKVVDRSPVLFLRTELTGELPLPVKGGKLSKHLFPFINIARTDDQALALSALLSWLWPDIAHPALYFHGEEGTAKSTAAKLLRRMVDPSPAELRRQPGKDEDFEISIARQWGIVLDNLSSISEWLSDAICTAITGTADIKRKKYADQELSVICLRRCFILTSIPNLLDRGDLVERSIPFELLPVESRMTDIEIEAGWEAAWPLALGALLDLASDVMAAMPSVAETGVHRDFRMADFALIAASVDKVARTRALPTYQQRQADSVCGAPGHVMTMSKKLRQISGVLRKAGVAVTFPRDKKAKLIRIERIGGDDRA